MIELLTDIKHLMKARKVRRMMVRYLKKEYSRRVETVYNIFEIHRISLEIRAEIKREEYAYKRFKSKIISKWKLKLSKQKG